MIMLIGLTVLVWQLQFMGYENMGGGILANNKMPVKRIYEDSVFRMIINEEWNYAMA